MADDPLISSILGIGGGAPSDDERDDAPAPDEGAEDGADADQDGAVDEDSQDQDDSAEQEPDSESGDDDSFIEVEDENGEVERIPVNDLLEAREAMREVEQGLSDFVGKVRAENAQFMQAQLQRVEEARAYHEQAAQAILSLFQPGAPPSLELLNQNPQEYMRQKALHDEAVNRYSEFGQQMQAIQAQRAQEMQAMRAETAQRHFQELVKAWPEWGDQAKAGQLAQYVRGYLQDYGLNDEMIRDITHPGFYLVVRDAMRYRLMEQRGAPRAAPVAQPKMVRGKGAPSEISPQDKSRREDMARLKKSGKIADAAKLIDRFL